MTTHRPAISKQLRVQVLVRDNYRCRMCDRTRDEVKLQIDHITPRAAGGTDELSNLAALCRDCNLGKSAYQFGDYTKVQIVPEGLASRFAYFHDPEQGDFEQFHLYCYFQLGTQPGGKRDQFHHSWRISGTQWGASSGAVALERRRRSEESTAFVEKIREDLVLKKKRLVLSEEGLCLL